MFSSFSPLLMFRGHGSLTTDRQASSETSLPPSHLPLAQPATVSEDKFLCQNPPKLPSFQEGFAPLIQDMWQQEPCLVYVPIIPTVEPYAKRRARQNRIAQRVFRQNRAEKKESLQTQLEEHLRAFKETHGKSPSLSPQPERPPASPFKKKCSPEEQRAHNRNRQRELRTHEKEKIERLERNVKKLKTLLSKNDGT